MLGPERTEEVAMVIGSLKSYFYDKIAGAFETAKRVILINGSRNEMNEHH
jgi:hypothetical protein